MTANIRALVLGEALSAKSREQLRQWLVGSKTSDKTLRAGVPDGWVVGDKTGAGDNATRNDVGVLWPPGRAPVIVSVYLTQAKVPFEQRSAAIAAVAKAVAPSLS